jgi:phage terminase large subunit
MENNNETVEIRTDNVILKSFYDFWNACRRDRYLHYFCKGGRDSAKSTSISQRIIYDTVDLPINTLVVRKVADTNRESTYEQLKEAASLLDIEEQFTFQLSPLQIIYNGRGNKIIFRGADDPQKIKSIKTSQFPIARCWFEEVSEFKTEESLQLITDSVLRDILPEELTYKFFYSYNPPKRKGHWLNKKCETQFIPKNMYVHTSYYYDNPFLSKQTLEEIENIKTADIRRYNWMYLGQPTGGGIVPFDNLVFRKIADEEINSFDNIRQGLDWGYASDPLAFGRKHYDKTRRILYFIDEKYGTKISNREIAQWIKENKYENVKTIADSAEPKSIAELKGLGINIEGAKKGEGSVEYGEKWLDDLTEIVIDPERTPNAAKEFEAIDYQVDRDGNQIPRLEDKDNHTIDETRYACEKDMTRGSGTGFLSTRS